jgi:mandelate racemase
MSRALGTSNGKMSEAPLVLIDLETNEGITGHAYLFCYHQMTASMMQRVLAEVLELVRGNQIAPAALSNKLLNRFLLLGNQGVVGMALSGFDVACWDALAKAAGMPLYKLLGGETDQVPAYNSNGLSLMGTDALAKEAVDLLQDGFHAVKLRLGYPTWQEDIEAVRAVRKSIPADAPLMTDYNQSQSVEEAIIRGRALDAEDITWIEEPIAYDDYLGCAKVAEEVETPIQIGENFCNLNDVKLAITMRSADFIMPDLQRIGGVTGWLTAASIAESENTLMSSHLFPEVSAHLMTVTPTAHWLEFVDWAAAILDKPMQVLDGHAQIPDVPGTGVSWNEDAIASYPVIR